MDDARRVVLHETPDGWRAKVQAGNWRTLAVRTFKRRASARSWAARNYPGVEVVEVEPTPLNA